MPGDRPVFFGCFVEEDGSNGCEIRVWKQGEKLGGLGKPLEKVGAFAEVADACGTCLGGDFIGFRSESFDFGKREDGTMDFVALVSRAWEN